MCSAAENDGRSRRAIPSDVDGGRLQRAARAHVRSALTVASYDRVRNPPIWGVGTRRPSRNFSYGRRHSWTRALDPQPRGGYCNARSCFLSSGRDLRRRRYDPPASIVKDCSVDVTSQLLSWISSVPNGSTLSFAPGGCYRIEGVLQMRGRSGLTFDGNGALFRSFNAPDDQRSMWRVVDLSGIAFFDMTLRGSYQNGGVFNSSLQHAHGIDLRGTSAEIANVTATDLAGDCFYFGLGYSSALTRSSGSVHDSVCSRTGRNGVSITAGNDIRIERVSTDAIGFTAFDVEPNSAPGFGSSRVTVTNNTIGSYYLYAWALVDMQSKMRQSPTRHSRTTALRRTKAFGSLHSALAATSRPASRCRETRQRLPRGPERWRFRTRTSS